MTSPSDTLRALLAEPALLHAPGVYDGLGAHLVRRHGFRAAYVTGAGIAASGFGLPDIGLTTATEMVERIGMIVEVAGLPVIADADTGYGNPMHVVRTVRAYERAGVAGLHLEDQAFPKRCGHLADKELVDVETHRRKLAAALENRREGIVVIARTDARGPLGIEEALRRAAIYAADGADAVFVEAPQSREEIERVADLGREAGVPLVLNVVPGGLTPEIDGTDLEKLGFAAAIHPGALLAPAAAAMSTNLARLAGRPDGAVREGPAGLFDLVGLPEWTELGHRYEEVGPWA